jgi:hypothetical protein
MEENDTLSPLIALEVISSSIAKHAGARHKDFSPPLRLRGGREGYFFPSHNSPHPPLILRRGVKVCHSYL